MRQLTRRSAIAASGSLLTALAGCIFGNESDEEGGATTTESVVGGSMEGTVYVFDQADGPERYTFQVEADHATGIAVATDRLVVGDETGLYGLSG